MPEKIALFWPGDYRAAPNEMALPNIIHATEQLEAALTKLGRASYRIEGFLTKPHEAIERLAPVDDPMIGLCVHWFYGPHTTDGVVGKDNPLLLASNSSGTWPGLVGLLNTGACLASLDRAFSRIWTDADDWSADADFMQRLEQWCNTGSIAYRDDELSLEASVSIEAQAIADRVAEQLGSRRALALMLGDTSMGMINGYFGPRLLNPVGFTEHKVDQAWIIDRGKTIDAKRIDDAFAFVKQAGVRFHWHEALAVDFGDHATR